MGLWTGWCYKERTYMERSSGTTVKSVDMTKHGPR